MQIFAIGRDLAGQRIAAEQHAGAGALIEIAEHHGLHGDRSAEAIGNAVVLAVATRAA